MTDQRDDEPRQREPRHRTRQRMLDAALPLALAGRKPPKMSTVIDLLGRTTGYAYQIYPTQEAFWIDLSQVICGMPWLTDDGDVRVDVVRYVIGCPASYPDCESLAIAARARTAADHGMSMTQLDHRVVEAITADMLAAADDFGAAD